MGFFSFKNNQVEKPVNTGDYFCELLDRIDVEATIDTGGLEYPEYLYPMFGKSVYVLKISNSPIRYINLRKLEDAADEHNLGEDYFFTTARRFIQYLIPDKRLSADCPFSEIRLVQYRLFYSVGPPIKQRWKGDKYYSLLLDRLNREKKMNSSLARCGDISVIPLAQYGFWILSERTRQPPTKKLWESYETIASHLISY